MSSDRTFDVVVFGATGFTGTLVVEYLAQHGGDARWAIAGRSLPKLAAIRERARALSGKAPEMIEADVADPESLVRMARQTRVVLTTVGPYVKYGEGVVEACIAAGSDYVDITGEPAFVARIVERHHAAAVAAGVRIVPCCGFDSIPHDLGAQHCAEQLPAGEAKSVRAYVSAKGQFSGGTYQSALIAMGNPRHMDDLRTIIETVDPGKRKVASLPMSVHREALVAGWGLPVPLIDPAIVLRSAAMLHTYGPEFAYGHYFLMHRFAMVAAFGIGSATFGALARNPAFRARLEGVRKSGEGPSEEVRRKSRFSVDFIGETPGGKRVRTRVSGGDPGYTETAKMLAESALCLALDRPHLTPHFGIVTTAAAMGPVLRKRLVDAGIRFEVVG